MKIIYPFLCAILYALTGNCQTAKSHRQMDTFNIGYFQKHQEAGHLLYRRPAGAKIEQWESKDKYYMEEETEPNSHYSTYSLYYYDTKTLQLRGRQFYKMKVSIWREYDRSGNVTAETDYEKPFRFSVEMLAKKMKKMQMDIMNPKSAVDVLRTETPKPAYIVIAAASPTDNVNKRILTIDGVSGATLTDNIVNRTK